MEIIIKGTPEEIAALVAALQELRIHVESPLDTIRLCAEEVKLAKCNADEISKDVR